MRPPTKITHKFKAIRFAKFAGQCHSLSRMRLIRLILCGWLPVMSALTGRPAPAPENPGDRRLDYFIIVTGSEILGGAFPDSHTHFITRALRPCGLRCVGSMTVDDLDEDLRAGLRYATNKASLVIVTGGLGPTDNDITRQTLSKFTGIPLREHPEVLAQMERRFSTPAGQLRANLRRQAQTPVGGAHLNNAGGTAVGLVFDAHPLTIVALPGPPRELQPMVQNELIPLLAKRFGVRANGAAITLRFLGLGQSQIDETIKTRMKLPPGTITTSQFEGGRVDFTFSLPDNSDAARKELEALKQDFHTHLGGHIYAEGETTLEETVLAQFERKKASLVLIELGSRGALAAALGQIDSSDRVIVADWMAASETNLFRALNIPEAKWSGLPAGLPRLKALAAMAADQHQATHVLLVGPATPRAAGAKSMSVLFKAPRSDWEVQDMQLRGSGDSAQSYLVTQILKFLWERMK